MIDNPDTDTWKPILQISSSTNKDKKKRQEHQFELDYKAEFDGYMKRKRTFEENCYKGYAKIWARFDKATKSRVESCKDYEKEVYNTSIKLIEAIKEHALNYEES